MIIKRSREITCQPHKYEQIKFGAEIEFSPEDIPEGFVNAANYAETLLNALLEEEITEASAVSSTDTFITTYRYNQEDK